MQPTNMITLRISVAAFIFCACELTWQENARAQNALGGGDALSRDTRHSDRSRTSNSNALDANMKVGGSGDNGAAAKTDFYSRNLIVTGDVGGGREFRGSVGYREQSEFTGQTGADDNRFWRAYSVYSSPYMAQANYNPLQASQAFGAIMYTRTYSGASARDILTNQQPLDARIAFDRFTADSGKKMKRQASIIDPANARDTSQRLNWRVTQAISQANGRSNINELGLDDKLFNMGISTYDRQRLKQDILMGRTSGDLVGESLADTALLPGNSIGANDRIRPLYAPEYSAIFDRMRARAGDRIPPATTDADRTARAKEIETELGSDMDWLRGKLIRSGTDAGQRGAKDAKKLPGVDAPGIDVPGVDAQGTDATGTKPSGAIGPRGEVGGVDSSKPATGVGPDGKPLPGTDGTNGKRDDGSGDGLTRSSSSTQDTRDGRDGRNGAKVRNPSVDDLAFILRHGRKLQSLVPEDSSSIRDMMALGATAMSRGEFFRAEERYASVLAVLPSNPSALAGVVNAQIGAGLSVSAALSLRKLFAMHPEMIDTHLGTDILPPPARLEASLVTARERLAAAQAPNASAEVKSDRFDFGLVVSYIGYQTDRPEVVREGLNSMRDARPDDALYGLLERVWLPVATEPTRPASPSVP